MSENNDTETNSDGANSPPSKFEQSQNEGMYKMFVSLIVFFASIYVWMTLNSCNLPPKTNNVMTFVMSSIVAFLLVTVWFDGVYKSGSDFKVNGIPWLTSDRPHYLSIEGGLSKCMGDESKTYSKYPGSEALSDTQRNFRHLLVATLFGVLFAGWFHIVPL